MKLLLHYGELKILMSLLFIFQITKSNLHLNSIEPIPYKIL